MDFLKKIFNFFDLFILFFLVALLMRFFVVQPFLVRGDSMYPTFHNLDYLFVERLTYYFREPQRGEVIVFHFPKNESDFFIKRIIGLPGERVIIKNGKIAIEKATKTPDINLDEHVYLPKDLFTQGDTDTTLRKDEYFVLGDNRSASYDSRLWGVLPRRDIVGKVLLRVLPPGQAKIFFGEDYSMRN